MTPAAAGALDQGSGMRGPLEQALRTGPVRLLASSWPWRSLAYLVCGVPLGLGALWAILLLASLGVLLLPLVVGAGLLSALCLLGIPVAALEHRRLRLLAIRLEPAAQWMPPRAGLRGRLAARFREPATWRAFAYAALAATVLWPLDLLVVVGTVGGTAATLCAPLLVSMLPSEAVPAGTRALDSGVLWAAPLLSLPIAAVSARLVVSLAAARAALVRAVLVSSDAELGVRLRAVTRSRSRIVEGFEAERHRIERDLHDGAQRRLLALSMTLGLARVRLAAQGGSEELAGLIEDAHTEAKHTLDELRALVRGIHPRVLSERGLAAALSELTGWSVLPVELDVDLPGRYPPSAESTAYFMVNEALANAVRHSGADRIKVIARHERGVLTAVVRDNGCGGADPEAGSGIRGLADRAEAVGGRLLLSSPPDGPTVLRLSVPCRPLPSASAVTAASSSP